MFHHYQQKISEIRIEIRRHNYQKQIYDNCNEALKNERSVFRKAETRLKKYELGASMAKNLTLYQIFLIILEENQHLKNKSRRELLITKLNQMAGSRVIDYLTKRVFMQVLPSGNIRSMEREELKVKKEMEKYLEDRSENTNAQMLIPYTFKIENLKADLEEAVSAYETGENARAELIVLQRVLRDIQYWGTEAGGEMDVSDDVFNHSVQAHMMLCSFKNELGEFSEGRDLNLHLEAITDFKNSFFNNLIADWLEEKKIKLALFYVRKTQNSLEALLQGLKTKMIRIESELSITKMEQNAILGKICQD
ncbi:hypothetical protein [Natronoflexus pectinivorans]|uniref:Uncharacterized protein n=1 Tax=Natronoflexus pectinivorans TaxID=682526 RepID=A0A4R2GP32_9BACT|nr:hypothetical protein [Natronoflexus pectinivorans]TCO11032.1 hypothetical protein EV194_101666 [Natronoflexus pectinivorans]